MRQLYDCADVAVGSDGLHYRVVVATHPASEKKSRVGLTRSGLVYELFFTRLPQDAFTAADVVALYLHRGAFEPTLADEDQEQDERLAGVVTHPGARKRGRLSVSGCGTSVWNWVISSLRPQCVPPCLLPPPPRPKSSKLLPQAMARRRSPHPGKQAASRGETLRFSLMAPYAASLIRRSLLLNSAVRLMAACAWSTRRR